jgi:hypothetical protein
MNRRHSQSSNATPVKSLTMSCGANAAIGLRWIACSKHCHLSENHRAVVPAARVHPDEDC